MLKLLGVKEPRDGSEAEQARCPCIIVDTEEKGHVLPQFWRTCQLTFKWVCPFISETPKELALKMSLGSDFSQFLFKWEGDDRRHHTLWASLPQGGVKSFPSNTRETGWSSFSTVPCHLQLMEEVWGPVLFLCSIHEILFSCTEQRCKEEIQGFLSEHLPLFL